MTTSTAPRLDLTHDQRTLLLSLLAQHLPGVEVWAHGSRVQNRTRPHSDLDLILFAQPEQYDAVSRLIEACEESQRPFRVDALIWDHLPPRFHPPILARHVILQSGSSPTLKNL
ncbi:MAG: nucleotidyltransferase domain-containing protein [Magnetococcales bacterium]|nr:nucleotidyltransferase domain-containing protein [Magnetococcales bacterium]